MSDVKVSGSFDSSKTNFSLDNNPPPPADVQDKSPEELKDLIESGELDQSDFPNKETFEKFIAFLSLILGIEIKLPEDNKQRIGLESKIKESPTDNKPKPDSDNHAPKEGVMNDGGNKGNATGNQLALESEVNNPKQVPATPENDIKNFDIGNMDRNTRNVEVDDNKVVLHSGANTMSIQGDDIGAEGSVEFLDDVRDFAEGEGYQEKEQQPEDQEEDDLDVIYFSKGE